MARFWVGGTGNWSDTAHWSDSSGGSSGFSVPVSTDPVTFDSSSGGGTVTVNQAADCASLTFAGGTGYTGIFAGTFNLTVRGDLTLASTMGTMTYAGTITIAASGGTCALTTATKTWSCPIAIGFTGSTNGGTVTLQDAFISSTTFNVNKGTFNTANFNMTLKSFTSTTTDVRSITVGTSTILLNNSSGSWSMTNVGNLTLSAASSTINLNGNGSNVFSGGAGMTYGTVSFGLANATQTVSSGPTITNFTYTGPVNKGFGLQITGAITVTGTFTLSGNSAINRVLVFSGTAGQTTTITVNGSHGAHQYVDFMDIIITGSAGSLTGTLLGDCLGNSGITFPSPVTQYYGQAQLTGTSLRLNGVSGGYVSAPDSAALSITTDITIDVKVSLDDWTPAANNETVAKVAVSGQFAYGLEVLVAGTLQMRTSADGTNFLNNISSVATGLADGSTKWLRGSLTLNDGAGHRVCNFYMSDDGSTWTQLGTTITTVGVATIADTTSILEVGSNTAGTNALLKGNVYNAKIYGSALGSGAGTPVFNADFTAQSVDALSFTESSANAATVSINKTSANWSAVTSWTSRIPLPQDNVFINMGTASKTVTIEMNHIGANVDCSGSTVAFTLSSAAVVSGGPSYYGSITLRSGMTFSGGQSQILRGRGAHTITSSGVTWTGVLSINALAGSYTLQDDFVSNSASASGFNSGTFSMNNHNFTCGGFSSSPTVAGTVFNMGSGKLILTATGTVFTVSGVTNLTVNPSTSEIIIANTTSTQKTLVLGAFTLYDLRFAGGTGVINFGTSTGAPGRNFHNIYIPAGTTVTTFAGSTTNVSNIISLGTSTKAITFNSSTPGQGYTVGLGTSGTWSSAFNSITDCTVTGTRIPVLAYHGTLSNATGITSSTVRPSAIPHTPATTRSTAVTRTVASTRTGAS